MEKITSPWQIIEKLRIKKGIPKKIIAAKLQINYNYLVDLLNGRYQSKIDDDKLRIISSVLDIPAHKLLDELHGIITDNSVTSSLDSSAQTKEKISPHFSKLVENISTLPITHPLPEKETILSKTQDSRGTLQRAPTSPPLGKTPVFRIISGSKIDPAFNQPELWTQKNLEFAYVPSLRETTGKPISFQPLGKQGILPATVAIRLEDNSLFPPCLSGSLFIVDATKKPRIGDIVLVVLQNYRAWIIELNKTDSILPDKEKIFFRPYNNTFEPIMVNRKDIIFLFPVTWIHPS